MTQGLNKTKSVKIADLCFYFDAIERDNLDVAGRSRKAGEVLALRERLLKLPDAEFEAAIKTLRAFVDEPRPATDAPERRQRAQTLYDEARPSRSGGSSGSTKVSPT